MSDNVILRYEDAVYLKHRLLLYYDKGTKILISHDGESFNLYISPYIPMCNIVAKQLLHGK